MRRRAAELGQAEFLSLWSGQGVGLTRELPVAQLVATLVQETRDALDDQTDQESRSTQP